MIVGVFMILAFDWSIVEAGLLNSVTCRKIRLSVNLGTFHDVSTTFT